MKLKRYYFDYAAGTPVDPAVEKAMLPYWSEIYGNPGALHWFGQEASAAVFNARDTIAKILGCNYREIIFTGSATEANNLALRGVIQAARLFSTSTGVAPLQRRSAPTPRHPDPPSAAPSLECLRSCCTKTNERPKIIVSSVEHDSILETARDLEREGVEVVYLPVSKEGIVDLKKLEKELDERTILVSVMYVNNEVGSINPISKISEIVKNFKEKKLSSPKFYPLFHTDAVQAFNYLNCNVDELGVDLLTLSAQKIYGPKGTGLLYARGIARDRYLSSIITGGSQQEYGLRGGTENVPAIVGFGKAAEIAAKLRNSENKRLGILQKYFLAKIKKISKKIELNGSPISEKRNPNNLNFYFGGNTAQDLLIKLDLAGFAVSPGAACTAHTCQPSHVLKALGFSDERATSSIRITFGRPTGKRDVDRLLVAIAKIFKSVLYFNRY